MKLNTTDDFIGCCGINIIANFMGLHAKPFFLDVIYFGGCYTCLSVCFTCLEDAHLGECMPDLVDAIPG